MQRRTRQAARLSVGGFILGYCRDDTSFVLGKVGRLEPVRLTSGRSVWIADIHQAVRAITGEEHPVVYTTIRKILTGFLGNDCLLPAERYSKVISLLQREGLLPGDDAA